MRALDLLPRGTGLPDSAAAGPASRASLPSRVTTPASEARPGPSVRGAAGAARCRLPLVELVQDLAQEPTVLEVLLADRGQRQKRHRREAAAEEREEAKAHLVGPVQVLENDDQRLPPGEACEKLADRLEEVARIPRRAADRLAAARP
jgi:hypothetical protein